MPSFTLSLGEPVGITGAKQKLANFETEEGRTAALDGTFRPRQTDVFVVTSPKCGTTWVQQVVHALRSRGDENFQEISQAVPWIEIANDLNQNLDEDHAFEPRCFKTHCWHTHCPKGGKYIYVARHPHAVGPSFYRFLGGWFFDTKDVSMEEFLHHFWLNRGEPTSLMENASYWHHLASWWPRRHDDDVLWLHYEDMRQDLRACIKRVAAFMGVDASDETLVDLACERSSEAYMREKAHLFDENLTRRFRNEACGLPFEAGGVKITQSGERERLPAELVDAVDARWRDVVLPVSGCATYEELRRTFWNERVRGRGDDDVPETFLK